MISGRFQNQYQTVKYVLLFLELIICDDLFYGTLCGEIGMNFRSDYKVEKPM